MNKEDYKFLIFTRTPWNEAPRARHQFTKALSSKYKVVFVEANSIGFPKLFLQKINDNLILLKSYWFYSYKLRYRFPVLNELYQYWLFFKLLKSYRDTYILINFDHTAFIISKLWRNISFYYCNDDHIKLNKYSVFTQIFKVYESRVAKYSTYCIATAQTLFKKLKQYNRNTKLLNLFLERLATMPITIIYPSKYRGETYPRC